MTDVIRKPDWKECDFRVNVELNGGEYHHDLFFYGRTYCVIHPDTIVIDHVVINFGEDIVEVESSDGIEIVKVLCSYCAGKGHDGPWECHGGGCANYEETDNG
jgi:hypothetical protein